MNRRHTQWRRSIIVTPAICVALAPFLMLTGCGSGGHSSTESAAGQPGLGSTAAQMGNAWVRAAGGSCDAAVACRYRVNSVGGTKAGSWLLTVTFYGSGHTADSIYIQRTAVTLTDLWRFERRLLPLGAVMQRCAMIEPSDQGGPAKGCLYRVGKRTVLMAAYLDPTRVNRRNDGLVAYATGSPFDALAAPGASIRTTGSGPPRTQKAAPTPVSAVTVAENRWITTAITIGNELGRVDTGISAAVDAEQRGDTTAAINAIQDADQHQRHAQSIWTNAPRAPSVYRQADALLQRALREYGEAMADFVNGFTNSDASALQAGVAPLTAAKRDLHLVIQAARKSSAP